MARGRLFVHGPKWQERLQEWALTRLPLVHLETGAEALGQIDDAGNILAVVLFERYSGRDVHFHIAAVGKRWATRRFLHEIFAYAFGQLGCRRITALIPESNVASITFAHHAGASYEGRMRCMLECDEDLLIFGMLREECRWIGVHKRGRKPNTADTAAA